MGGRILRFSRRSVLGSIGALAACSAVAPGPKPTEGAGSSRPPDKSTSEAVRQAAASARELPAGDYTFEGAPLDGERIHLVGAGSDVTTIRLLDDYLIDSDSAWKSLHLEGVRVVGGKGVVRNRFAGTSVAENYIVRDCHFLDYSECAISHQSSDMPYWNVSGCIFFGREGTKTIGVALSGLTDGCQIQGNRFLSNQVHVKLRNGGNNAYIRDNDFIQFREGRSRVAIWVVPHKSVVNSGAGLTITSCKFGNENLHPSDYRILYSDEAPERAAAVSTPSDRASSGYITGHFVDRCLFNGAEPATRSPIFSRASLVIGCRYGPVFLAGTRPDYLFEIEGNRLNATENCVVGPVLTDSSGLKRGLSNAEVTEVRTS